MRKKNAQPAVWLILLFIVFGTILTVTQQMLRLGANDPQIQMAQDTAAALDRGTPTSQLLGGVVRIDRNLAPFVMVYDKTGKLLSGNAVLNNAYASIPSGTLTAANGRDYNAVTWQPKKGVRLALVTVSSQKYYVAAGRSLKEVEKREQLVSGTVLLGGTAAAVVIFVAALLDMKRARKAADIDSELTTDATPKKQAPRQKS